MGNKEQRHDEEGFTPPHRCTECGANIFEEGHVDGCPAKGELEKFTD